MTAFAAGIELAPYEVAQYAERYATRTARRSRYHGPRHWHDVARIGRVIALADSEVDPLVVFLFAALHDTRRHNDWCDPEHGKRAAEVVNRLWGDGRLRLSDDQVVTLMTALTRHDRRGITINPDIGACWDADRLTLPRVGTRVDPNLLSSRVVKANLSLFLRVARDTMAAPARRAPWRAVADEYGY